MEIRQTDNGLLISDARVVLLDRLSEGLDLLIEDGRIASVVESVHGGSHSGKSSGTDLSNTLLFPGFIDAHIHGAVGIDTMAATSTDLTLISSFLASHGVTGWLPTLVPAATAEYARVGSIIEMAMALQNEETNGARILGLHYEGPFVNTGQCGALHSQHFRVFSQQSDLDFLRVPDREKTVKMITVAPEIDGGIELIKELSRAGWVVSLGHTRANVATLDKALEAGAQHMTHFMNAMPALHHRAPGPVGWGLSRQDVSCDVIADGVHLDPLVLRLLLMIKSADRLSLISDAIAAAGRGDGEYQIWGETITVRNGRTSNVHGSIAGSVISMLDAVRMMRSVGAPEVEVARMASTNPARVLGVDDDCGSIEVGKRADLVALDEGGNARLTIVGGQIVFDSVEKRLA